MRIVLALALGFALSGCGALKVSAVPVPVKSPDLGDAGPPPAAPPLRV